MPKEKAKQRELFQTRLVKGMTEELDRASVGEGKRKHRIPSS